MFSFWCYLIRFVAFSNNNVKIIAKMEDFYTIFQGFCSFSLWQCMKEGRWVKNHYALNDPSFNFRRVLLMCHLISSPVALAFTASSSEVFELRWLSSWREFICTLSNVPNILGPEEKQNNVLMYVLLDSKLFRLLISIHFD